MTWGLGAMLGNGNREDFNQLRAGAVQAWMYYRGLNN